MVAKKTAAPAAVSATNGPATTKAPAKKAAATKAPAAKKTSAAAKTPATKKRAARKPTGPKLAVRDGESAWTAEEIAGVQETLHLDVDRLEAEILTAETDIASLLRQGGEGAGNDQADVGSNTFERDHEVTMARNARANLELVTAALGRIQNGTYGVCESCGEPIGKMRLQAFPRATLCLQCKQRQERR